MNDVNPIELPAVQSLSYFREIPGEGSEVGRVVVYAVCWMVAAVGLTIVVQFGLDRWRMALLVGPGYLGFLSRSGFRGWHEIAAFPVGLIMAVAGIVAPRTAKGRGLMIAASAALLGFRLLDALGWMTTFFGRSGMSPVLLWGVFFIQVCQALLLPVVLLALFMRPSVRHLLAKPT